LNPASTQPTDSVKLRIVDRETLVIINKRLTGLYITTNRAYPIQRAAVQTESFEPGVPTTYTFEFWPEHEINKGGGLLITAPQQISLGDEE
jgi:hypothetical protein